MTSEILELANQIENTLDWLKSALNTAGNLSTEDTGGVQPWGEPIYRSNDWKEMHEVCNRLDAARRILETALEPIKDVIAEEQKRQDDGPDEIDPHGFKYHPLA